MEVTEGRQMGRKAAKERRRKTLRSVTPNKRTTSRRAQKVIFARRQEIKNKAMTVHGQPNLLTLPYELREHIYDSLLDYNGKFTIVTSKPSREPRETKLHQVCTVLRSEIEAYFFKRQTFCFKTQSTLEFWGRKYRKRLARIEILETSFHTWSPVVKLAGCFKALKMLLVDRYGHNKRPCIPIEEVRQSYQVAPPYPRLLGSTWLGDLLTWRQPEAVLDAFPQFRHCVIENFDTVGPSSTYQLRFCLDDRKSANGRSELVDMEVVRKNIDNVVPQLRYEDHKLFPIWVEDERYQNWRDFVRRKLGRSTSVHSFTAESNLLRCA